MFGLTSIRFILAGLFSESFLLQVISQSFMLQLWAISYHCNASHSTKLCMHSNKAEGKLYIHNVGTLCCFRKYSGLGIMGTINRRIYFYYCRAVSLVWNIVDSILTKTLQAASKVNESLL